MAMGISNDKIVPSNRRKGTSMTEQPQHEMRVDVGGGREQIRRVDYPANSKVSKLKKKTENENANPERTPVEKIVSSPVGHRSNIGSKVLKTFLVEDGKSIFEYVLMDVLIPAAKNTISDVVTGAIQQAFYGGKGKPGVGRPGYTSYNRVAPGTVDPTPRTPLSRQARATHDFSDVILKTRGEAEDVIDMMRNMIDQYEMVSVMDLYDMLGLTGDFTDAKWGWTDLRNASVRPVRGGYLLDLPGTTPLT
jgi:hypothetical protein